MSCCSISHLALNENRRILHHFDRTIFCFPVFRGLVHVYNNRDNVADWHSLAGWLEMWDPECHFIVMFLATYARWRKSNDPHQCYGKTVHTFVCIIQASEHSKIASDPLGVWGMSCVNLTYRRVKRVDPCCLDVSCTLWLCCTSSCWARTTVEGICSTCFRVQYLNHCRELTYVLIIKVWSNLICI